VRYEAGVDRALAEVATALVAYDRLADVEREQAHAVNASREAVRRANSRYLSGLADYLEVLQAQQQLFPAELDLTRVRFERLATLVELYRALGGGWQLPADEWTSDERPAAETSTR
jgi:multidrug efflux system outer membrane protein